jgi:hypothetical protein
MLGPVRILMTASAAIMPAILELRDTEFHGLCCTGESFLTRQEAANRERYYKTGKGRDELDRLDR